MKKSVFSIAFKNKGYTNGKTIYKFYDFFGLVNPEYKNFVINVHGLLSEEGYRVTTKCTPQGFIVSYSQTKTRRNILRIETIPVLSEFIENELREINKNR